MASVTSCEDKERVSRAGKHAIRAKRGKMHVNQATIGFSCAPCWSLMRVCYDWSEYVPAKVKTRNNGSISGFCC